MENEFLCFIQEWYGDKDFASATASSRHLTRYGKDRWSNHVHFRHAEKQHHASLRKALRRLHSWCRRFDRAEIQTEHRLYVGELPLRRLPGMEKINARWSDGLFMGVRARSFDLLIVDRETNDIQYARTVRGVPLEQRWSAHGTEVKKNDDADGDVPEFDVKQDPGSRLTPGDL